MQREFKGIWIPKEIWLAENLTTQEKLFWAEIDSLNGENGCWASNEYFADFFTLSVRRCQQVIQSLKNKGYTTIEFTYKRGTKEVEKRVLRTVIPPLQEISPPPCKKFHDPHARNFTYITKSDNKDIVQFDEIAPNEFDLFWNEWGYKKNKKKAKTAFLRLSKTKRKLCLENIQPYKDYINATGISQMHATTWINGERWNDDFIIPEEKIGANTNEVLNDVELPAQLETQYQKYIAYVIDSYPQLWKSKCQVFSKSQWYQLRFQQESVYKMLPIRITDKTQNNIKARLHALFNSNHFERAKYSSMYEATKAEYKRYMNNEKLITA